MRYRCALKTYIVPTFWLIGPGLVLVSDSPGPSAYEFFLKLLGLAVAVNVWNWLYTISIVQGGVECGRRKRTVLWAEIEAVSWGFAENGALWSVELATKEGRMHKIPLLLFSDEDIGSVVEALVTARPDLRLPLLTEARKNG